MGNSKDSTGRRVFDDVYSFPQDSQDLADDIFTANNFRVGTSAQRQELPSSQRRVGMSWQETDTDIRYVDTASSGWVAADGRIVGRVKRSAAPTTFPSSGYTNVANNAFWDEDVRSGFAPYNNGWTIPLTGRYSLSYEIRSVAAFLAGLAVNYTGTSPSLILATTPQSVQGVAAGTVTGSTKLNAGDVVRPYLLASSGVPAWVPGVGFFSVEWVGAD